MRGSIYFTNMPKQNVTTHSCQSGRRPVLVVSSNIGNRTNSVVMVCPMTTKIKHLSCNVDVEWTCDGRPSQVLCNQIMTMPKDELQQYCGHITLEEQKRVDIAMCISLGINIDYSKVRDYDSKR